MKAIDENYFKAVCVKCGVNVETPNELYDQRVDCPGCGESFLARPPIPVIPPQPTHRFLPKDKTKKTEHKSTEPKPFRHSRFYWLSAR